MTCNIIQSYDWFTQKFVNLIGTAYSKYTYLLCHIMAYKILGVPSLLRHI
jgi:hypothetical protein